MFKKVLIANRGEIAVRIIRACRELGVRSIVAHSEADRDALPVQMADESFCIGPAPTAKSYLNPPNIITAALVTGADAIHPGYGFLSENIYFAEICEKCHVTFIGPRPDVIATMGDKAAAREKMAAAGLPVLPGTNRALRSLEAAQDEAQGAFGNNQLYMEKYLERCRHVEVQVLGDTHGNVIHLGERDCSIQRRQQKIVEEAPSPALSAEERARLGALAVQGARAIDYSNAGTLEFLRDAAGNVYFLEMNTRIQVEHAITEAITGIDLVKEQLRVATGEPLSVRQEDVTWRGHAIECRVNAEDPNEGFAPRFGTINAYLPPGGPGIRMDSHLYTGYRVPIHYDSLLAKVIAWGADREEAVRRMARALEEFRLDGLPTTIPFLRRVMQEPSFRAGEVSTDYIERLVTISDEPAAISRQHLADG